MYDYKDWGDLYVKLLDKFIKKLKTDRNTFFAFILTLLTKIIVSNNFGNYSLGFLYGTKIKFHVY